MAAAGNAAPLAGGIFDRAADAVRGRWYGKWGGPGYSAGRYLAGDEPITPEDLRVRPTDFLDSLFKRHDIEYGLAQTRGSKAAIVAGLRKADEDFARRAKAALKTGQISGWATRKAAELAIDGFEKKLNLNVGYEGAAVPVADPATWRDLYTAELEGLDAVMPTEPKAADLVDFGGTLAGQDDDGWGAPGWATGPLPSREPPRLSQEAVREAMRTQLAQLDRDIAQALADDEDDE